MSSKSAGNRIRPPRRPWSIALRLTVWYAAAGFALVLGATGYLYWALAQNMDREDDQFLADKIGEVCRVLDDRPGDRAALEQEVLSSRGGAEHEAGRLFVRVVPADGSAAVETPGMDQILPRDVFPRLDGPAPREQSGEFEAGDGKAYRLRGRVHGSSPHRIYAAMDRSHDEELLEEYRHHLAYVLGVSLVAVSAGGYWIARRGVRPIADVTSTAQRIRPTHMNERIDATGLPAEIRDLAHTFNHMLDRLEDAFTRLGRFSADIAHELRTPVNNLRGEVEVTLGRSRSPDEYREVLGSCLEECGRLTRLIDSLLFLARAEDPKTELVAVPVDVKAELSAVREFFAPAAAEAGVRLEVEAPPDLIVRGDRQLLQQAVGNLVANALSHTPAGGSVTLFAAKGAGSVCLGVRDTGSGIASADLPYIFDRFYRADAARASARGRVGHGLGLSIVKGIADLHRGTASAASPPGQGTTVTLVLPG
ncbi:heavy metal sensor histidine kinase [Fimbriiglobus ruber]|uniref:histidine kinase n=1 Tax=Fimbriiglobus ruber TaxID=1908690 RepID=A0A225D1X4_9BACT|nr:heavy metal sensor histidine kinase [Fimbriiglobus ruber]OWK35610.1 Heavy metal sensor histidine kinase [Fimbriiglobus ruber]